MGGSSSSQNVRSKQKRQAQKLRVLETQQAYIREAVLSVRNREVGHARFHQAQEASICEAEEARIRDAEEARFREAQEASIREAEKLRICKEEQERERLREQEQIRIENETLNLKRVEVRDTLFNLWVDPHFNRYLAVQYIQLSNTDSEYKQICQRISNKQNFIIDRINRIENPLLKKSYELRRIQKEKQFPRFQERLLFHGVKSEDVDDICKFNFDWRLVEKNAKFSFGNGISFSSNSKYASDGCSDEFYNKVMLLVKVLIGKSCPGNRYMEIPTDEFDTSMKSTRKNPDCDDIVTVKYDDGDFYPAYKIHYHLLMDNTHMKRNRNGLKQ